MFDYFKLAADVIAKRYLERLSYRGIALRAGVTQATIKALGEVYHKRKRISHPLTEDQVLRIATWLDTPLEEYLI